MRHLVQPPSAAAIVNSLRAIGYSFNTALADIIDNSLSAGASKVSISFRTVPAYVAIVDDGAGMTEDELVAAMRHGGVGPTTARAADDLGRYGLGLKTASLSQCRRLTVVSLRNGGQIAGARWDLDEVELANDWILEVLDDAEARVIPCAQDIIERGQGTVVLWENLDRATAGEASPADALIQLVLESAGHLSLVFHRYLSPTRGRGVTLSVNDRILEAADPFMLKNPLTEIAGEESVKLEGSDVFLRAYILPHISRMSAEDLERAGGRNRLRETQGFYIYRNRRLITYGTWFRLLSRDELTRLARVQVDIPNALDHLWGLDVKKSTANPPEQVRAILRQIIQVVAAKSGNVFKEKRRRSSAGSGLTYLWDRSRVREGLRYELNRQHPLIEALGAQLTDQQRRQLEGLLSAVELALPVRQIYIDQASNDPVEQATTEFSSVLPVLLDSLLGGASPERRRAILDDLMHIEPFMNYPEITRGLIGAPS